MSGSGSIKTRKMTKLGKTFLETCHEFMILNEFYPVDQYLTNVGKHSTKWDFSLRTYIPSPVIKVDKKQMTDF